MYDIIWMSLMIDLRSVFIDSDPFMAKYRGFTDDAKNGIIYHPTPNDLNVKITED